MILMMLIMIYELVLWLQKKMMLYVVDMFAIRAFGSGIQLHSNVDNPSAPAAGSIIVNSSSSWH